MRFDLHLREDFKSQVANMTTQMKEWEAVPRITENEQSFVRNAIQPFCHTTQTENLTIAGRAHTHRSRNDDTTRNQPQNPGISRSQRRRMPRESRTRRQQRAPPRITGPVQPGARLLGHPRNAPRVRLNHHTTTEEIETMPRKKKQHGGPRTPGPGKTLGRPASDLSKVAVSFRLAPDVAAWLKSRPNQGEAIEAVVRRSKAFRERRK